MMASLRCRTILLAGIVSVCAPGVVHGQPITLTEAVRTAESQDRSIHVAELEREKALREVGIVRTRRFPTFSITALGSQPLTQLGITLERGSLGVYPHDGPIPGQTTTLESPLRFGFIGYASVAQPLTQQYKIGLGIELAQVGVEASAEQIRAKRQAVVNEVRRLYYGIAQAESGRTMLQASVDFLRQLDRETGQHVVQRVALQADLLNVKAQLVQAEYELLKMDDPIQTQKEQLNRLMGRPIDAPLEIDVSSIVRPRACVLDRRVCRSLEVPSGDPFGESAAAQEPHWNVGSRAPSESRTSACRCSRYGPSISAAFFRNSVSSVGLQATWDVFDWGRKRQEIQTKQDAEAQAALELKDTEARVMADVAHQYRRILEARKEVELAQALPVLQHGSPACGTQPIPAAGGRAQRRGETPIESCGSESSLYAGIDGSRDGAGRF